MKRLFFFSLFLAFISLLASAADEKELDFAGAASMAVQASNDLRSEYSAKALREGAWRWGLRAYLPRLSVTASEDDRLSETGPDSFHKNYSVNMEQLLWDGGRLSLSRRLERAELDLAGDNLRRMAADIADAAVSAYRDVLHGRMVLEIQENTFASLEEQLRILEREVELGLARPSDLLEAEITVALAALEILSLDMALEEAEWRLAERLGLEKLPVLSERIDTERSPRVPTVEAARSFAESGSPELAALRHSIVRRQTELKTVSRSWIPSLRMTGSFAVSGQHYPLSRYSWSVGLVVDFASPWLSGSMGASAGWDPPHDRNARLQQTITPAPDPAGVFSIRSAKLALSHERSRYEIAVKEIHAAAERGVRTCALLDRRRILAQEALELEGKKFHLAELRLSLGQLTRIDLMEARLNYAKREAAVVEAAAALLHAERELERLLDLAPGELSLLAETYDTGGDI
ncbi:MAG: TolC family protein [Treponema sp.]|nr:TolC family protein [Treponema sp.]